MVFILLLPWHKSMQIFSTIDLMISNIDGIKFSKFPPHSIIFLAYFYIGLLLSKNCSSQSEETYGLENFILSQSECTDYKMMMKKKKKLE